MATWLVQTNLIANDQLIKLGNALVDLKIPFEECIVVPFSDELLFTSTDSIIIPYGSTRMTKNAKRLGLKGLYFNEANFKTSVWAAQRPDMLNSDANVMSVDEMLRLMDTPSTPDGPYFIRPVDDLKAFNGCVHTKKEIRYWLENAKGLGYQFEDFTQISIAKPKQIKAEWRWFVVDHKVVDGSMYVLNGKFRKEHVTDKDVIEEAQMFAELWTPDDVCTMDLALTDDGLKVVEFNTFNSTGFYDHDILKIVEEVTKYTNKTR